MSHEHPDKLANLYAYSHWLRFKLEEPLSKEHRAYFENQLRKIEGEAKTEWERRYGARQRQYVQRVA